MLGEILMQPMVSFKQRGFTMLELLLVLSLLAMIATLAVSSMENTGEDVADQLARSEMHAIREALLQFKRDTGYFPNSGNAACTAITQPANKSFVPADLWQAWCAHSANFWMLFENPGLEEWNPDLARGWRGPYLNQVGDGLLTVPVTYPASASDSTPVLTGVRAIADPLQLNSDVLVWQPSQSAGKNRRWGRPYLLIHADSVGPARLVWTGKDGEFNGHNLTNGCEPNNQYVDEFSADLVLCLH
jgi:prepilin-type N-terminal cleavage/methylation domain-containing protein